MQAFGDLLGHIEAPLNISTLLHTHTNQGQFAFYRDDSFTSVCVVMNLYLFISLDY